MKRNRTSNRLREKEFVKTIKLRKKDQEFCDETEAKSEIDVLPDEILALIFQRLDFRERFKLEIVNRRWNRVVIKYGWSDFKELQLNQWTPSSKKIDILIKRCGKYLRELNLHGVRLSECGLLNRLSEIPKLRHISITLKRGQITGDHLRRISSLYPQLLSLNIWKGLCFTKNNSQLGKELSNLLSSCDSLEYLSLCRAQNIDVEQRFQPTTLPSNLIFLETDDTFDLKTIFEIVKQRCVHIKCLSLQFLSPTFSPLDISINTLRNLVQLEFDFHRSSCPSFFIDFISVLDHLGNLRIFRCAKITGNALTTMIEKCPNLEDLGYSAYQPDILPAFCSLHRLTKLQHLAICHLGKAPRFGPHGSDVILWHSLQSIAQNGRLRFLSSNFEVPIELVCNLVKHCKTLINTFCPIHRLKTMVNKLSECIRDINRECAERGETPRILNLSVNYDHTRALRDPFIRFLYQPELGSEIAAKLCEQLFTDAPKFMYTQLSNEEDDELLLLHDED